MDKNPAFCKKEGDFHISGRWEIKNMQIAQKSRAPFERSADSILTHPGRAASAAPALSPPSERAKTAYCT
jgi:hypothetical protein